MQRTIKMAALVATMATGASADLSYDTEEFLSQVTVAFRISAECDLSLTSDAHFIASAAYLPLVDSFEAEEVYEMSVICEHVDAAMVLMAEHFGSIEGFCVHGVEEVDDDILTMMRFFVYD